MPRTRVFVLAVLALMLLAACGKGKTEQQRTGVDPSKPISWGKDETIFVFADDSLFSQISTPLRQTLERTQFTTEDERYFIIEKANFKELAKYYRYKNLLFITDINSDGPVSNHVKSVMPASDIDQVQKKGIGLFVHENWQAQDQLMIIMAATSPQNLLRLNNQLPQQVFNPFLDKHMQRIKRRVFARPSVKADFFANLPFSMYLPTNFVEYKNQPELNHISWLNRNYQRDGADRYISVYWEKADSSTITPEWLTETRLKQAWDIYDEDTFVDEDIVTAPATLGGKPALKLSGRWINEKHMVGGAFQSFACWLPQQKLNILVDTSVYFPAGYKLDKLLELKILCDTIKFK